MAINKKVLTTPKVIIFKTLALFIWLIIRLIQFVFSAGTVFFSHKKSANSVFQPAYNSSRTAPLMLIKSWRPLLKAKLEPTAEEMLNLLTANAH
jgi:hypothetical protein